MIKLFLLRKLKKFINENYSGESVTEGNNRHFGKKFLTFVSFDSIEEDDEIMHYENDEDNFIDFSDEEHRDLHDHQDTYELLVDEHLIESAKLAENIFEETEIYVRRNKKPTFSEKLFSYIDGKNISDIAVYKKAGIDRRHFSKIRSANYKPSKKTALQLGVALELNLDQMLDFLSSAGYTLSDSNKTDLVIKFFIINKLYNLDDINYALYELKLESLF